MTYEARQLSPSSWVVWNTVTDTRHSEASYFYRWLAEAAARDCEAAFNAGADHAQQVSHIQETLTERCWCNAMLTATDKCTIHAEAQ